MKTLEVSIDTYNRLANHATGFESPENVIIRLLNAYEFVPGKKPELSFIPENEDEFKRGLVESRLAHVELHLQDGTIETGVWNARSFSESSNLRANIWSGYLRNWEKRGIVSASFEVVHSDNSSDEIVETAHYKYYLINHHASGSISVKVKDMDARPVMPFLKEIAEELNVSTNNSNNNPLNTRQLGVAVIRAINPQ
ncbi:TPA: hypothetical protein ACJJYX_004392 [Enterobacter cloacae]